MAETSGISWTDGTWNPWYGCDKVGGAESECANCYIGRDLQRMRLEPWGKVYRAKTTWDLARRVQKKAIADHTRYKLFTCSLSDFFHRGADAWRPDAWDIVRACPDVDFLVLTKRANRIASCLPPDWGSGWPNVWLGVSVGRMMTAWRVDRLRQIPARVRFISAEPLLESLAGLDLTGIQWLIAGGESGTPHRPMDSAWAEELRAKCAAAGVAYWFKQDAGAKPGMRPDLLGRKYQEHPPNGLTTITFQPHRRAARGMATTNIEVPKQVPVAGQTDRDFNAWKQRGETLVRDFRANEETLEKNQWEIGDWLVAGDKEFKQKAYDEAKRITGWSRGTLYNVVLIVRRFPPSLRSETNLTWSHFKELARIEDEQTREQVLTQVDDGFDHSVRELREIVDKELERLKEKRPGKSRRPPTALAYLRVRLFPHEFTQVKQLAKAEGKRPHVLLQEIIQGYLVNNKAEISAKIEKARRSQRKRRP